MKIASGRVLEACGKLLMLVDVCQEELERMTKKNDQRDRIRFLHTDSLFRTDKMNFFVGWEIDHSPCPRYSVEPISFSSSATIQLWTPIPIVPILILKDLGVLLMKINSVVNLISNMIQKFWGNDGSLYVSILHPIPNVKSGRIWADWLSSPRFMGQEHPKCNDLFMMFVSAFKSVGITRVSVIFTSLFLHETHWNRISSLQLFWNTMKSKEILIGAKGMCFGPTFCSVINKGEPEGWTWI